MNRKDQVQPFYRHFWLPVTLLLAMILLVSSPPGLVQASGQPQLQAISFSHEALVTRSPFSLTLTNLGAGSIHYTTNGSLPEANSPRYSGPIPINQSTVIRAQLFDEAGNPVGGVYTKSYIIATYEQTIPVISLVTDWGHFNTLQAFPEERGREWERPVNIEYFEPGGRAAFNIPAGIRVHGNFSRLFNPKKSYRIYFRTDYGGPGRLKYPLFADSPVASFDKIVLKAGFQDSFTHRGIPNLSDKHHTARYINDQVVRNLHRNMGQPIAHGSWVLLYLNGEFWGLYNMTERIDLQFLQSYSVTPDGVPQDTATWDVIAKESGWDDQGLWYNIEEAKEGNYGGWLDNQNWVGSADFSVPENIGALQWRVDMENVYSYMFLQAYIQNTDWPDANWVVYQRTDPGAVGSERQWRMMVWDAEAAFGGGADHRTDINTLVNVYSPHDSITRILEKPFIRSCYLKHDFVNRAREYLGVENSKNKPPEQIGQLSKENIKAEIMAQAAIVRPFIGLETQRWAPDLPGEQLFENNIQQMLRFVDEREAVILGHLDNLRYQTFTECQ